MPNFVRHVRLMMLFGVAVVVAVAVGSFRPVGADSFT